MNRFAELLDRLAYEPGRNNKIKLIAAYFRETEDPDRGYALAAMTGALTFRNAKAGMIRALITQRTDSTLFAMSYDYVGDLSETIALMWPARDPDAPMPARDEFPTDLFAAPRDEARLLRNDPSPTLADVVETLATLGKAQLPGQIESWLDALDETGRWALLKLVTGSLRIGVSARLAKTAAASLGGKEPDDIEVLWPGLEAPYIELFAWLEGKGDKPTSSDPAPFRPAMLAHGIEDGDLAALDPADFIGEWKWDGIRVQAVAGRDDNGAPVTRLYSRTGEDISKSFPDLLPSLRQSGAIDGELLVLREGRVQSFNVLQQRLNRKSVTSKLIQEFPAHLRAYDLLADETGDLRALGFTERRAKLEAFVAKLGTPRIDISPLIVFDTWDELIAARADPESGGAGDDADAVEGVMLKRRDAPYVPGRPKGQWWKWKRDPMVIDAVLMYAQRGHGKRSSFYSDYTFGVWNGADQLVPVGKAYFGFTDDELTEIDRFVRRHTVAKFGPMREVTHEPDTGLVLEVAFEGLQQSTRHKSGIAMRFPRINRLRWDKPPREADRLETLEKMMVKA